MKMEAPYLDAAGKAYYLRDMETLINFPDPYWAIEPELFRPLKTINAHPQLQSLYSRHYGQKAKEMGSEAISYLRLAYFPEKEKELTRLFIRLIKELDGRDSIVTVSQEAGIPNANYREGTDSPLGCLNNPDYFRVTHFYVSLESKDLEKHHLFWEFLERELGKTPA